MREVAHEPNGIRDRHAPRGEECRPFRQHGRGSLVHPVKRLVVVGLHHVFSGSSGATRWGAGDEPFVIVEGFFAQGSGLLGFLLGLLSGHGAEAREGRGDDGATVASSPMASRLLGGPSDAAAASTVEPGSR